MNFLLACKSFLYDVLRDRTTSLEEFITANKPTSALHVEQLEREYYAKLRKGSMV